MENELTIAMTISRQLIAGEITNQAFLDQFGELRGDAVNAAYEELLAAALANGTIRQGAGGKLADFLELTASLYPRADAALWHEQNEFGRSQIAPEMRPILSVVETLMEGKPVEDVEEAQRMMRLLEASSTEKVRDMVSAIDPPATERDYHGFAPARDEILSSSWAMPSDTTVGRALAPFLAVHGAYFELIEEEAVAPVTEAIPEELVAFTRMPGAARAWPGALERAGGKAIALLEFPDRALAGIKRWLESATLASPAQRASTGASTRDDAGGKETDVLSPLNHQIGLSERALYVTPECGESVTITVAADGKIWEFEPSKRGTFSLVIDRPDPKDAEIHGLALEPWVMEGAHKVELVGIHDSTSIPFSSLPQTIEGSGWLRNLLTTARLIAHDER